MLRSIVSALQPQKLTRQFGMLSNPNDPHVKYKCESTKNHGKSLYYPKYGNSYYDALEYNRILETRDATKKETKGTDS